MLKTTVITDALQDLTNFEAQKNSILPKRVSKSSTFFFAVANCTEPCQKNKKVISLLIIASSLLGMCYTQYKLV